jgi:hypothetical protein
MPTKYNKYFLAIAMCAFFSSCAGLDSLIRVHAYEGARKPASEMATVYGVWNGPGRDMAFVCKVDGKSYWRVGYISNCPSVVYLLPGKHELSLLYEYQQLRSEDITVSVTVETGRTYQVVAKSFDNKTVQFDVQEKAADFKLTYKDLVPRNFEVSNQPNPYVDPSTAK